MSPGKKGPGQMAIGFAEVKRLSDIFPSLPQLNVIPGSTAMPPAGSSERENAEGYVDRAGCVCVCCGAFLEQ